MPIPRNYCRFQGKKCMDLRVKNLCATCKKTGRLNKNGSEAIICRVENTKDDIKKPSWCPKK